MSANKNWIVQSQNRKWELATDKEIEQSVHGFFMIADADGNTYEENVASYSLCEEADDDVIVLSANQVEAIPSMHLGFKFKEWDAKWFVWKAIHLGSIYKLTKRLSRCSEIVEAHWRNPRIRQEYGTTFAIVHRLATSSPEPYYAIGSITHEFVLNESQLDDIYARIKSCHFPVRGERTVAFAFRTVEDAVLFKLAYSGALKLDVREIGKIGIG